MRMWKMLLYYLTPVKNNKVNQSNTIAGGDIVGRDLVVNDKKETKRNSIGDYYGNSANVEDEVD